MTREQRGLERRLDFEGRRIHIQHERLAELVRAFAAAVDGGASAEASRAVEQLEAGFLAHFEIEERVHFPALHGARDALTPQLDRLIADHRTFEADLSRLRTLVEEGALVMVKNLLLDWLARVEEHEALEESLYPTGTAPAEDAGTARSR